MSAPPNISFTGVPVQPRSSRISPAVWDSHKAVILQEFHNKGLAHTKKWMEKNRKFYATMKQYQYQIYTKWRHAQPSATVEERPAISAHQIVPRTSVSGLRLEQSMDQESSITPSSKSPPRSRTAEKMDETKRRLSTASTRSNASLKKARLTENSPLRPFIIASRHDSSQDSEDLAVLSLSSDLMLTLDDGEEANLALVDLDHLKETADVLFGLAYSDEAYHLYLTVWYELGIHEPELLAVVHILTALVYSMATKEQYGFVEAILESRLDGLSPSQATERFLFGSLLAQLYLRQCQSGADAKIRLASYVQKIVDSRDRMFDQVQAGGVALNLPLLFWLDRSYCYIQTGSARYTKVRFNNSDERGFEHTVEFEKRCMLRNWASGSHSLAPGLTSRVLLTEPITHVIYTCQDQVMSLEELEPFLKSTASADGTISYDMVATGLFCLLAQRSRLNSAEPWFVGTASIKLGYGSSPMEILKVVCIALVDIASVKWSDLLAGVPERSGNLLNRLHEATNILLKQGPNALRETFVDIYLSDRMRNVLWQPSYDHIKPFLQGVLVRHTLKLPALHRKLSDVISANHRPRP